MKTVEQNNNYYSSYKRKRDSYSPSYQYKKRKENCDNKDGHYLFNIGEMINNRYEILSFVGEGTFARVVEAWDRVHREPVALKIVRAVDKYTDAAEIEIDILRDIHKKDPRHESRCVEMINFFMFKEHMCLVFPKYGLSLYDFIKKNKYKGFMLNDIKDIGFQIMKCISFIHSMNLIHTDLKPENILLKSSKYFIYSDDYRVPKSTSIRVIDFGSATYDDDHHTTIISTRHYRAPEVLLEIGWTFPADVWSIGCILVELYTGEALYQTHENREHLAMIEKTLEKLPTTLTNKSPTTKYFTEEGKFNWPTIATDSKSIQAVNKLKSLREILQVTSFDKEKEKFFDLCEKCLKIDPNERITAKEAMSHPFFK